MRQLVIFAAILTLQFQLPFVQASEPPQDAGASSSILAKQGKGIITQDMFSARAARIPAAVRQEVLRNGARFEDVLGSLLLNAQLAADAHAAGFDKQTMTQARMQLAAEGELAMAWLQHYVKIQPDADYVQLAHEYYQLHPEEFMGPEMVDTSHILIAIGKRSESEALKLADTLYQQLLLEPTAFDRLVTEYSEDPSAASNQGKFLGVKRGDMVKPFEDAAFALNKGEISAPVKSEFGYHIIRLDGHIDAKVSSFDDEKQNLIISARNRHQARNRMNYLNSLKSNEMEVSEVALDELISRLVGVTEQAGEVPDSE